MATKDQPSEEKQEKLVVEKSPHNPEQSQENLITEELPHHPVESRENLIHTAVSFLQNPKVRDGPVAHKKAFLRKKGLTEEEISDAFIRSGTVAHVPQPMAPYPLVLPPPVAQVTPWMRIRETMVAGLLVWGLSKAAHRFYTEYVSPYFDLKWPQERRLEVIENSVLEMQNNLVETMKKVQEVVATVQHQQKQMLVLTEQLLKNMPSSGSISLHHNDQAANEIKAELNSIKGILLSRKQFPTVPNTSATLPPWQLNTSMPAAAAATPQALEPETKACQIPNKLDILPNLSSQTSANIDEASNSERVISIEDNKDVDNPNYVLVNGGSNEQQEVDDKHDKHGSKKSRTKKEDSKKKNNNNSINGFSTEQTNKFDKSHVI